MIQKSGKRAADADRLPCPFIKSGRTALIRLFVLLGGREREAVSHLEGAGDVQTEELASHKIGEARAAMLDNLHKSLQ